MEKNQEFDQQFIQLVIGLQASAWMSLGKQMNPITGKVEVDLDLAKNSIDTLLMLKEKTKGNLTETERGILEKATQNLELNYIDVSKEEEKKKETKEKEKKEEEQKKEEQTATKEEQTATKEEQTATKEEQTATKEEQKKEIKKEEEKKETEKQEKTEKK